MDIVGWLRRLFLGSRSSGESSAATALPLTTNRPTWCVVANVLYERPYGPSGAEIRRGTKHFAPGAKVYVFHFFWGTGGERVKVIGRHRKTKRYITIVMSAGHLANWRAELVYSPHVIAQVMAYGEFAAFPQGGPESRARAEEIVASYIKGGAVSQPFTTRLSNTEPGALDGGT